MTDGSDHRRPLSLHAAAVPARRCCDDGSDWHGMTTADGELGNLKNRWDVPKRLETMDELRIDVQLVSPTDVFYQYHQPPEVTERISQEANEEIAGMVRDHPDRFMGLGTLPMQDPERAVTEMTRGMKELGLTGFMIDDHVNGLTYDHDLFEPVWEAAQDLGVFLLIHQFQHTTVDLPHPEVLPAELDREPGRPHDHVRGVHLRRACSTGIPDLTICLCHGGGYVPVRPGPPRQGVGRLVGRAREVAGSAEHLRAAVLLRHGRLHASQPAVPDRRGGGRPGRLRHRLAGADDVRRPGRPPRDDDRALRRRASRPAARHRREPVPARRGER